MAELEFLFDFGSPNAYLAWRVLPSVEERLGKAFVRTPVLLGGIFKAANNQSPFVTFGGVKGRLDYEMLEIRRFCADQKITEFRMNPNFPQNSLLMMRTAHAALADGDEHFRKLVRACFQGMWEEGLKLDDPDILRERLDREDLDGASLIEAAATPEIKNALIAVTEKAFERGVFGLPTFFVGDEMFFGKDRIAQVERAAERLS